MCESHSNYRQFFKVVFFLVVDGDITCSTKEFRVYVRLDVFVLRILCRVS